MIKIELPYPENCSGCLLNGETCRKLYIIICKFHGEKIDSIKTIEDGCPILKDDSTENVINHGF